MKAEYINPFISEFQRIFTQVTGAPLVLKRSYKKDVSAPNLNVIVELGMVGDIQGDIAMQLDQQTAKNIVSSMMGGMSISDMDEIAQSAIAELGNMVTGSASSIIADQGKSVDITTPKVSINAETYYKKKNNIPTLAFVFEAGKESIELNITLQEVA